MLIGKFFNKINSKYRNHYFSGLSFNSRNTKKNNIFFAIKGTSINGNRYINDAVKKIYNFVWGDYCDWYIEFSKSRIYGSSDDERRKVLSIAVYVLKNILKLFHPFAPFITEEIWSFLDNNELLAKSPYPEIVSEFNFSKEEEDIDLFKMVITSIRNIKSNLGVSPKKEITIYCRGEQSKTAVINKVVVLGFGASGQRHAKILSKLIGKNKIYVYSSQENILYKKLKTFNEIITLDPDYIIIASDTSLHYQQLKKIEDNLSNKVILIEKPIFNRKKEIKLCKNIYLVGYNLRFHPLINMLKKEIQNEKIYSVNISCFSYLPNC